MKALILVGGFGTRLRPLTLTLPKPLVEFCNKPMILHQIEALVRAGVKDIVLAVNYRPEVMVALLSKLEEQYDIKITFSVESEPLGTAGPLALAREVLGKDDSPFFVLNSDVTCSYPFEALRDFHVAHGNEGTIMVTKVDEPSKYGVVVSQPGKSLIDRFVEKPVEFVGNRINAGIYIFSPRVLDRIELKPTSIEKETFPAMVRHGELHWMDLDGFWMDVGQPKDYLTGTCLYLSALTSAGSKLVPDPLQNPWVHGGNVLVDPTAVVDPSALIGPNVVIGPRCRIGKGVRLQRCALLEGSEIRDHAWVRNSIVGWNSTIGRWARVDNFTVLGDDVAIRDELFVNGASVLPHKSVSSSIIEPAIIMSAQKVKAYELLGKSRQDLTNQLSELKEELSKLRVQKITGTNSSKLTKISAVRKAIARVLTVIHLKQRQNIREFYKCKKHLPLDLRPKKTRAIRRRLSQHEERLVTERTKKRLANFPKRRRYAVKAEA